MGELENRIEEKKQTKEVVLTEANWLFLKHLRLGASIQDAYKLAGYTGEGLNAPYALYHGIKKKLQEVVNSDGFDKLRLSMDFQKILSLPLASDKQEVSLTEWLKIRRLAHTIMNDNEAKSPQASFTMIVIESGQPTSNEAIKGKVIDIEPLASSEGKASEPTNE